MAEQSFPFDSEIVNGAPDRAYMAEIFRKYFYSFVNNGVFAEKGDALQVLSRVPEAMQVVVRPGQAWAQGAFYDNDDELVLSISEADPDLNRIDAVVVRCDYVQRIMSAKIVTGVPATEPLHYTPVRNADMYELLLAEIYVPFASINVKQTNITDYRPYSDVCGWVTGYLQSIDADSFFRAYQLAYEQFMDEAKEGFGSQIVTINDWYSQVKDDIALLQAFNFDNLAILPNCRYTYTDGVNTSEEMITSIGTGKVIARRLCDYSQAGSMTVQIIRYASDGVTEVDNTVQAFDLSGDEVEITGFVGNVYNPDAGTPPTPDTPECDPANVTVSHDGAGNVTLIIS